MRSRTRKLSTIEMYDMNTRNKFVAYSDSLGSFTKLPEDYLGWGSLNLNQKYLGESTTFAFLAFFFFVTFALRLVTALSFGITVTPTETVFVMRGTAAPIPVP